MTRELPLPDVGEGIAEAELLGWLVAEGEAVAEDQPVAEVETDKAAVDVPSPVDGTVIELHADEGTIVAVGEPLVTFDVNGEAAGDAASGEDTDDDTAAVAASDTAASETAAEHGAGATSTAETGRPSEPPTATAGDADRDWTLAVPRTRHLARELGVDIDRVPATERRDGEALVTEAAVRSYASREAEGVARNGESPGTAAGESATLDATAETTAGDVRATSDGTTAGVENADGPVERVPYRGIRRTIGEQMERSKYTAPHVSHFDVADAETLVETRVELAEYADERGVRLTYSAFVLKAAAAALQEFPYMNATLDEAGEEIVLKEYYHIGFATATENGLLVPVVDDVDEKSLLEVAADMNGLAERARKGSIGREEMQGSTFTVTNVGNLGGEFATPIINYPEVAILGVGAIRRRPRVVGDEVVPRQTAPLSVSFDHRVIDGATVARFTSRVADYLEDPSLFLLG